MISIPQGVAALLVIINTYLFSIYIVPQINQLKKLKDKLYNFRLPYLDEKKGNFDKEEVNKARKYVAYVSQYKIEHTDLIKMIDRVFIIIEVILIGMFCIILAEADFRITSVNYIDSTFLALLGFKLFYTIITVKKYLPDPSKFFNFSFLINKQGLDPNDILKSAELQLSLGLINLILKNMRKGE